MWNEIKCAQQSIIIWRFLLFKRAKILKDLNTSNTMRTPPSAFTVTNCSPEINANKFIVASIQGKPSPYFKRQDTVNSHLNDCQFPFLLLSVADYLQKACKYSLEFLPGWSNMAVIVPYIIKSGTQVEERNKIPLLSNLPMRGWRCELSTQWKIIPTVGLISSYLESNRIDTHRSDFSLDVS